jgi:hypothetical protein
MQLKDRQYMANILNRIAASVTTVNDKIIANQQNRATVEDLMATVALEQLTMQHQILTVLVTMAFDPGTSSEAFPEPPKKIMGFR